MKVWIDQDLCTGDGLCEEIAPDVFTLLDDGLAYVKEGSKIYATAQGNPQGAEGLAVVPAGQEEATIESAEECPGECIFIEIDG
jgi:ferredoxin